MSPRLLRNLSRDRLVLCGSDSLALRLVEELNRLEEPVTVVVDDKTNPFAIRMAALGARLIEGPARDLQTLRAAGVEQAVSIALLDPDDVDNVHAALTAQELNPYIRLVIRMFHPGLGERIDNLFNDCTVLSPGAIAAPSFVDAALGDGDSQVVRVAGRVLQAGPPDTVREIYLPLALDGPSGLELLPSHREGAQLVLGPPLDEAAEPGLRPKKHKTEPRKKYPFAGAWRSLVNTCGALIRGVTSMRARTTLILFAILAASATIVFQRGLNSSWIDAFYRTITVVTSTGFDDLLGTTAPGWLKLFGAVVMLLGVLLIAMITAIVVDDLIDVRVAERLGIPVGNPTNHVVVCGLGAIGLRVAERLVAEGVPVVGIQLKPDAALMTSARRLGMPVIEGDASQDEILLAAGVQHARCVAALTNHDITNLQAGLACRTLNPKAQVVLRLFDSELAAQVERRLGLAVSRSVSMAAAPVFAAAMLGREVMAVIPCGRGVLLIADIPVAHGSAADGAPISLMDITGEARVLAHIRGLDQTWHPNVNIILEPNDRLILVVTRPGLTRALRMTGAATAAQRVNT